MFQTVALLACFVEVSLKEKYKHVAKNKSERTSSISKANKFWA